MWKLVNGKLTQLTDSSRVKFRTNISRALLNDMEGLAEKYDTCINYLIETGLEKVLKENYILFDKATRPKDRIQYKTTYDSELLKRTKQFAVDHGLFINDVIEYSCKHVDPKKSKNIDYRYRIEKG